MRFVFSFLVQLNKTLFPKYWKKDLSRLSSLEKLVAGYKIWLGKRAVNK